MYPALLCKLFENFGKGPKLRKDIVPSPYWLGNFYMAMELHEGFEEANGAVIQNAYDEYPEAWEWFQNGGKHRCVTEEEWQRRSYATWHTLADGTKVGFNGVGGVGVFVQDLNKGTLRLPDARGMHFEGIGGPGSPSVGEAKGDMGRVLRGLVGTFVGVPSGVFYTLSQTTNRDYQAGITACYTTAMDSARSVPIGEVNRPRSIGVLPVVYLGTPR